MCVYVIAVLRKGGGRKRFYGVLIFSTTGFFWVYFLFYGLAGYFYSLAWRHQLSSCPRFYFASSTQSLAWDSPVRSRRPPSTKLISLFLFPLTKRATSVFRVLANHSASFSFPHPVRRFVRTTISSTRVRLQSTDSLTYSHYFLQQAGRSWPTFLIPPFNGQTLAAC